MENLERLTLAEMEAFVENNRKVRYTAKSREVAYGIIEGVLKEQGYRQLSKGQKGIVRRYLVRITGLSRAQVTRLLGRWMSRKRLTIERAPRRRFARRYTAADIVLLAEVDSAHEDLSGPAVRRILQREHELIQLPGEVAADPLAEVGDADGVGSRAVAGFRRHAPLK